MMKSSKQSTMPIRIQTVIDIGTLKTSCFMAKIIAGNNESSERLQDHGPHQEFEILGAAHQQSRGVKAGVVVDLDAVEATLKSVIGDVEKQSGLEVTDFAISVSCGRLKSHNFRATTPLEANAVTAHDIARHRICLKRCCRGGSGCGRGDT